MLDGLTILEHQVSRPVNMHPVISRVPAGTGYPSHLVQPKSNRSNV